MKKALPIWSGHGLKVGHKVTRNLKILDFGRKMTVIHSKTLGFNVFSSPIHILQYISAFGTNLIDF